MIKSIAINKLSVDQFFAIAATVAVFSGIVAGFWVLGTPGQQRLISGDRQRLRDIRNMAQELYWKQQDEEDYQLPESLPQNDLGNDPITGQPYEYRRLSQESYQFCSEFATDSSTYPLQNQPPPGKSDHWAHPVGRHCFDFNITEQPPTLY